MKSIVERKFISFICNALLLFIVVFFSNTSIAQTVLKQQVLYNESEDLVNSKPNEALKIAFLLLNNANSSKEKARINYLIATIYKVKADYSKALTHLYDADKNPHDLDPKNAIEILTAKAEILRVLFIEDQAKKNLEEATTKLEYVNNSKEKELLNSQIVLEKVNANLERQKYKEALSLIKKHDVSKVNSNQNAEIDLLFAIAKGKIYCGLSDFENGNYFFRQALQLLSKSNFSNKFAEANTLIGLAVTYFHQKEYEKAIVVLLKASSIAKNFENLYLIETSSKLLTVNYIALNDNSNYKLFNTRFLNTNAQLEGTEQEAINTAYNLISQEQDNCYKMEIKNYSSNFYMVLILFVLVLFFCILFLYRFHLKKRRLREIINYLEVTRNNLIIRNTEKKETNKKIFIPIETEQALLNKLKRFESSSKFTNNDMSLAVLSGQFETNTKYLSEIINKHYHVNFNTYINKLRINFIIEKLKSDPNFINYKISYLAETSGFSSHSTFATIFKSITGIAPITFIEFLKKERETSCV